MAAGTAMYTTAVGVGNAIGSAAAGGIWSSKEAQLFIELDRTLLTPLSSQAYFLASFRLIYLRMQ